MTMKQSPLCRMCGVSMRTIPDGTGLCDDCKDELKLQEELYRTGRARTPVTRPGPFPNIIKSNAVPPNEVYMLGDGTMVTSDKGAITVDKLAQSDAIARQADTLMKITGSPLTAEDLQRAMDGFGKLSEEKTQEVLELATQRRAEQVREVRQRVLTLLRPVVEEDMSEGELQSLAHALMAQMAPLGGTDIEGLYPGVSEPS